MWSQIIKQQSPFSRLKNSKFRSSFKLTKLDIAKVKRTGLIDLRDNIVSIIEKKLTNPDKFKDGKQTPWSGNAIFVAQHATATCCRKCLFKWYRIPPNNELTDSEMSMVSTVIYRWIVNNMKRSMAY